jgi:hypothetical protein
MLHLQEFIHVSFFLQSRYCSSALLSLVHFCYWLNYSCNCHFALLVIGPLLPLENSYCYCYSSLLSLVHFCYWPYCPYCSYCRSSALLLLVHFYCWAILFLLLLICSLLIGYAIVTSCFWFTSVSGEWSD